MPALAQAAPPQTAAAAAPRVWLVLGDKPGDNAQVEIIAPALGWPYERRQLQMLPQWVKGKPRVEPSLHHLDLARSELLEPPWPDLVLTIGRRPSMVALWIAERSGGRTKLVLVGKPSGMMERFDLVIAGAEAQLSPLPNVLAITLPLMRVDPARLAAAEALWRERLAALPRPLTGFLIGGPTGPFRYDDSVTGRLLELAHETARAGGTPYLTTSRRTPPALVETLRARLPAAARLFHWTPDATDNPYLALLAAADGFVVTGDSISMMVEIARLGRPLAILDLPTGRLGGLDQSRRSLTSRLFAPGAAPGSARQRLAGLLHRSHLLTHTRDFRAFHRLLIERGLAVRAGEGFPPPRNEAPDDLDLVVSRIRGLLSA
jgi:mitochondrial fission protein ELM1